jgi:hypothetical protein
MFNDSRTLDFTSHFLWLAFFLNTVECLLAGQITQYLDFLMQ